MQITKQKESFMRNYQLIIATVLLTLIAQLTTAQNNTNSPYTRFGYGEIIESTAVELKGMGGVSLANRSLHTINSANPASYSSVDSLTFMFDMGAGTRMTHFSDQLNSHNTFNANLEYITMRFPVTKWMGFSAGMQPFSLTGYNFSQNDSVIMPDETEKFIKHTQSFSGTGGFSQVYGGLSVNLFNHVSIGANAYYIFGESSNYSAQTFEANSGYNPSVYTNQIKAADYKFRYGLQAYHNFAKKHDVSIGLIYENKSKLNGQFTATLNNDTIRSITGFELPQTLGAGFSYTFDKSLTIAGDFTQQKWADALYFGKTDSLVNTNKMALGMEYVRNPGSWRKYSDLIRYRIGFSTSNQYYKVGNQLQPNNYVISAGIGLPTRTGKSMMNISFEYGKIGSATTIREDYFKLSFGASINEYWFVKPKL